MAVVKLGLRKGSQWRRFLHGVVRYESLLQSHPADRREPRFVVKAKKALEMRFCEVPQHIS